MSELMMAELAMTFAIAVAQRHGVPLDVLTKMLDAKSALVLARVTQETR